MKTRCFRWMAAAWLWMTCAAAVAQVPQLINYQGKVQVGAADFNGTGQFKFALVNAAGTTTYWSNNGSSSAGAQPTAAVSLTVAKGIYSLQLGDTSLANMTALPATVFANSDVRMRVWFNDGPNGFQQLSPDQRIVAVGYAMVAGTVPDGSITPNKLAATSTLTISVVGEMHVKGINTNPPPVQMSGTMTIPGYLGDVGIARNVTIVKMAEPQLEFIDATTGADSFRIFTPGKKMVSQLVVRRPATSNVAWREWASYFVGNDVYRTVTLQFNTIDGQPGIAIALENTFVAGYRVEQGTDGIYYETLTLKPNLYERQ